MAEFSELKKKAAALPDKPGIYFFKTPSGEVVYIGKARSLRDRVRSYFLANPDFKVRNILHETADIDEAVAAIARTWRSVHERVDWSNTSAGAFIASV